MGKTVSIPIVKNFINQPESVIGCIICDQDFIERIGVFMGEGFKFNLEAQLMKVNGTAKIASLMIVPEPAKQQDNHGT